jgi:hypothetical protein
VAGREQHTAAVPVLRQNLVMMSALSIHPRDFFLGVIVPDKKHRLSKCERTRQSSSARMFARAICGEQIRDSAMGRQTSFYQPKGTDNGS